MVSHSTQYRLDQLETALKQFDSLSESSNPIQSFLSPDAAKARRPLDSTPMARGSRTTDDYLETLLPTLRGLPSLESGVSQPPIEAKIAIAASPGFDKIFDSIVDTETINEETWEAREDQALSADLLLLAPPWGVTRGKDSTHGEDLFAQFLQAVVIPAFKQRNLPVIFWGLGDPKAPEHYIEIAQSADYIFSPSLESLTFYQDKCVGVKTYEHLSYAVNPRHHSPLGSQPSSASHVYFDSSYGLDDTSPSATYCRWALDGAQTSLRPLVLAPLAPTSKSHDSIPSHLWPHLSKNTRQDLVARFSRIADVVISPNDVIASQSAFSSNLLDHMATGSLIISTYNQGINSHFPHVRISNSSGDVHRELETLGIRELRRSQADGIRQVFMQHHARDVAVRLLQTIGCSVASNTPKVLAVATELTDSLDMDMRSQSIGGVETVSWDELSTRHGHYDILLPVTATRRYASSYAEDHVAAFSYQSARITSKLIADSSASAVEYRHRHSTGIDAVELTAWWRPDALTLGSPHDLEASAGTSVVYEIDSFGHQPLERRAERDQFSTPPENLRGTRPAKVPGDNVQERMERASRAIRKTNEELGLRLTVVVPVYNNGTHLRHKCFASLRRSSIFNKMQILLINDGSTDLATVETIDELADSFANVTAFHYPPGGSGSASRPRNTGLKLSETPYVTYLDPDNEATEDGYAVLLEDLESFPEAEFGIGNISVWRNSFVPQRYFQRLEEAFADSFDDQGTLKLPSDALSRVKFRPISIQAAVIRTAWLKSIDIEQPLGAVGQDTYFFQQMFHYANMIRPHDICVHTYYSAVANSTVNSISPGFYRKYIPLEEARAKWLGSVGLLEDYKEVRLEQFLRTWHLSKLELVETSQWREAAEVIDTFTKFYGHFDWKSARVKSFFERLEDERNGLPPQGAGLSSPSNPIIPSADLGIGAANAPLKVFQSLDELFFHSDVGSTRYQAPIDSGMILEGLYVNKGSDVLVVAFHGAISESMGSLPRFEWLRTLKATDYNLLFLSDPTLRLDPALRLSWYVGSPTVDLQPLLASVIGKAQRSSASSTVLLTGSSGGGFASLQISSHVPASIAVPFNSQTEISRYHRFAVSRFLRRAMPSLLDGDDTDNFNWSEKLGTRASATAKYMSRVENFVYYVQNSNDLHHVEEHYRPFRSSVESSPNDNRFFFEEYDGPEGHLAPARPLFLETLNRAIIKFGHR